MGTNENMVGGEPMNTFFPVMDCYEYLDLLKDDDDINEALLNNKLYVDVINEPGRITSNDAQDEMMQLPNDLKDFNEQCLSASDTSLADQNSPQTLYSPDFMGFGSQDSPSSGSTDSGIITSSAPSSPILSPDIVDYADQGLLNNLLNDSVGLQSLNSSAEYMAQNQLLMKYLIEQQVRQALLEQQQENEEKLQQLQQEAQFKLQGQQQQQQQQLLQQQQQKQQEHQQQPQQLQLPQQQLQQQQQQQKQQQQLQKQQKQQQLLLLAQQQQLLQGNIQNNERNKTDSQLRKMLQQTKDNIINSLHVKKVKNLSFKCHKSNSSNKLSKRKLTGLQNDVKPEKVLALTLSEGNLPIASMSNEGELFDSGSVQADSFSGNMDAKQTTLSSSSQTINLPTVSQPVVSTINDKQISDNMFIPQPTSQSSPFLTPNLSTASTTPKIAISRLKPPNAAVSTHIKSEEPKKTRIEHVVIEKRYRMKITDSLNELKCMLTIDDDKKATKNSILQAAIYEIKRLKRENEVLTKKYDKMKKIFDELRKIGILATSQNVSCSSSESNMSDTSNEDAKETLTENIDPLVKQDHFVSPFQRQSARDGGKILTCFALVMFLCINPLSFFASSNTLKEGGAFTSRHLMSIGEQEHSPHFSLVSNLFNIILSLVILMFMLLRGNPKCTKDSKITQCFRSQLNKAQKKIDRHEYEEAKGFIRIALFVIGNSCPKTLYGQFASFLWKMICHILYQLGLLKVLESIGYTIFPRSVSSVNERVDQEYTARLSAEAYRKLHEIALIDGSSSTYLEAACYLMNAIYAAEISGDHELLCNAYTTAVVHMHEKLWFSYVLRYYFTGCAHHASLASSDGCSFKVDWIFESRGYEFFTSGLWDIRKESVFKVIREDTDIHQDDLLEKIYSQFQEYLLMKAIRRMVVPERYYPNEGKIELRQRAQSFLSSLGTGPVSEQLDTVSVYYQSLYGWWGSVLTQLIEVMKNGSIDVEAVKNGEDHFEDIDENHRHDIVVIAKSVISGYIAVRDLQKKYEKLKLSSDEMEDVCYKVQDMLHIASQLMEEKKTVLNCHESDEEKISKEDEMKNLIYILCCDLLVEASYVLWQINPSKRKNEKELEYILNENQIVQSFASKYPELGVKAQKHDFEIQCLSGNNQSAMGRLMKRAKHIQTAYSRKDTLNGIYSKCNHYPLKQDGFTRCR